MSGSRFAFVSTLGAVPWGGSEELWWQTALRLRGNGAYVAACVKEWDAAVPQVAALTRAGCVVRSRRPKSWWQQLGRRLATAAFDRDARWLRNQAPDLVVISQGGFSGGGAWSQACRERGVKYVMISQAVSECGWPTDEAAEAIATAYSHAERVFFVSRGNLELVEAMLGQRLGNAEVVRNPFNVRWDAEGGWPSVQQPYRLACVGRLEPKAKGQDLILRVLARRQWQLRPVVVALYGSGRNERTLRCLAEELSVRCVSFAGFTDDVEDVWRNNHALILPSRHEGLPLAIVEAMLCARPVITTRVAGNAEIVEDNVSGFVAEAPTVDLLDEAMERAWNRRGEWKEMGEAAARRVRELVPSDPVAELAAKLQSFAT